MIVWAKLVVSLPLTVIPIQLEKEIIVEDSIIIQEPFKDTMHYNTLTNEELIRENNEKIIQQIYKTLE